MGNSHNLIDLPSLVMDSLNALVPLLIHFPTPDSQMCEQESNQMLTLMS